MRKRWLLPTLFFAACHQGTSTAAAPAQTPMVANVRGDLRGPGDPSLSDGNPLGARTMVTRNLIDTTGVLQNTLGAARGTALRVTGLAILDAENLGYPNRMIARVLQECGDREP